MSPAVQQAGLWRPACPCDTRCLPAVSARSGLLTTCARVLAAAWVMLTAVFRPSRSARVARSLLRAFGIRWSVVGGPIAPGALVAGNHISWLDIILMMAIDPRLRLVGKHDVATWPIIGRLAKGCGTIFVDRSRPRTLPGTVAAVASALRAGHPVQVFPEGTTTCGAHPARWRPAFLQAAIDAGSPVQRFTLLYSTPAAAFIGDESLLTSLWRVLRTQNLTITVLIGQPVPPDPTLTRQALARRLSPPRRHTSAAQAAPVPALFLPALSGPPSAQAAQAPVCESLPA
jgi:1-acyl-sn-glycerol-3-phosphate acyltransferase